MLAHLCACSYHFKVNKRSQKARPTLLFAPFTLTFALTWAAEAASPAQAAAGTATVYSTHEDSQEAGPYDKFCRYVMTLDSQRALATGIAPQVATPNPFAKKKNGNLKVIPDLPRPRAAPYLTIAVDPAVIPLGTVLEMRIPGSDEIFTVVAGDTGGKIKGKHIDIALCFADSRKTETQQQDCANRMDQFGGKGLQILSSRTLLSQNLSAQQKNQVLLRKIGQVSLRKTSMADACGTYDDQQYLKQTFHEVIAIAQKHGDPKSITNQAIQPRTASALDGKMSKPLTAVVLPGSGSPDSGASDAQD